MRPPILRVLVGLCVTGMLLFRIFIYFTEETAFEDVLFQPPQPSSAIWEDAGDGPYDVTGLREGFSNSTGSSEYQVPNLVHYIWYNEQRVSLHWYQMLCIISAHDIINPDVLYFHTNREPTGPLWFRIRSLPRLKILHRDHPKKLYGEDIKQPRYLTDYSDVDRLLVLMEHGGIYLDLDVLVVKPFDHLRQYPCTIGLEKDSRVCGGVIVASKEAHFVKLWLNSYLEDYRVNQWAYNTGVVPYDLWKRFPEQVHVEETRLHRPNWEEIDHIIGPETWDWQNNYSVHLWYRRWKRNPYFRDPNGVNIKSWNCTFGQIARFVLFGSPDFVKGDHNENVLNAGSNALAKI